MAVNTNKRVAVKHVRDKAKSAYEKKSQCHICESTEELELHHTNSISLLLEKWAKKKGYDISTDEGILRVRDEFIEEHHSEIYDEVFTLCNKHHVNLHKVFGKAPELHTALKQSRWIEKQRAKFLGLELEETPQGDKPKGLFSKFY
jgi:5-methylcytosine-specific restriction endonuclease McrA